MKIKSNCDKGGGQQVKRMQKGRRAVSVCLGVWGGGQCVCDCVVCSLVLRDHV